MKARSGWPFLLVAFFVIGDPRGASSPMADESRAGERIPSSVIGAGGRAGTSTNFGLQGTLGQPTPPGTGVSMNYVLRAGFWWKASVVTGIAEEAIPPVFRNALHPNVPNPFNPATAILYEVEQPAHVGINIYDVRGRLVRKLVDETRSPGRHEAIWDGRTDSGEDAPSGIYLCRARIGTFQDVRKLVLVK